jgi:predicted ester cyclase
MDPMKGFSNRWQDFPDYILGITREIWEDRGIATLHHYYTPDLVVRSPSSVVVGNQNVIGATMATLAEFPDRTLLGEDVIWSGTPETGMLSSHRIFSTATHLGDGVYGKATGKKLGYRIIADCHAINDQINDEWLIRDQGAIVRQMGWDPSDYARDLIDREGGPETAVRPFSPAIDKPGPYQGRGNDNEWGARYADILTRIMGADMAVIRAGYDRACQLELPGGVTGHSHGDADQFWMGLRSAFPDAKFEIHHQIGRDDPMMPPRAALRWSLHGKHSGWGAFGRPTGAEVHVMGLSHAEFGALTGTTPRLRREFVIFDETAIWKQIIMHTGAL